MPLLEAVTASSIAERINPNDFSVYARSTRAGQQENNPVDNQLEAEIAAEIDKTGVLKTNQNVVEVAVSDVLEGLTEEQKLEILTIPRREIAAGVISDFTVVTLRRSRTTASKVRDAGGDEDAGSLQRTAEANLERLINSLTRAAARMVSVAASEAVSKLGSTTQYNDYTF